jgi:hypothetical protein
MLFEYLYPCNLFGNPIERRQKQFWSCFLLTMQSYDEKTVCANNFKYFLKKSSLN